MTTSRINYTIENVNGTISGLREPIHADLAQGVARTNDFKIDDTVENLRIATDNLGQLTDQLKQRPWSLIRAKQPKERKVPE
ncbi:MAG TPA: hypothetical protein VFE02_11960 [Candidatus Acidoferrales bacterium]|nr:hypothetical protein [Candidatus Acidoferrales bacterium]